MQTWRGVCTGQTAPPPTSTRYQKELLRAFTLLLFLSFDSHFVPLQPMKSWDPHFGAGPDDGEHQGRMGRSLSGTVVTSRHNRLTATRSFVSWTSCTLLPPCGHAVKSHLPDLSPFTLCVLFSSCCLSRTFRLSCFF